MDHGLSTSLNLRYARRDPEAVAEVGAVAGLGQRSPCPDAISGGGDAADGMGRIGIAEAVSGGKVGEPRAGGETGVDAKLDQVDPAAFCEGAIERDVGIAVVDAGAEGEAGHHGTGDAARDAVEIAVIAGDAVLRFLTRLHAIALDLRLRTSR